SLGREGVRVFALNDDAAHVRFSRYCRLIRPPWKGSDEETWTDFLLGPEATKFHGAVLLACCDAGIRLVARCRESLARVFVLADYRAASEAGVEVMLVEMIPGPDSLSWGYHTYLDDEGRPLFHLVRRSIRRCPVNRGESCYVTTDWDAEVAELGLKLVRSAGL